ncbi:MAG: 4Fe-4S dicluster domain-containing protein [Armatimonadetes bacterium]|nr:4Fe-4S dicluster domain-containing protein [Armatimonadota bacterium]
MRVSRREFLTGVGATAAGVGLSTASFNHLIPFLDQPDDIEPGVASWYATGCRECPAGCAMIVRNRESRAVKCEGNTLSPLNRGRLCARGQAALMGLYDPDRIPGPMQRDDAGKMVPSNWTSALSVVGAQLAKHPRVALMSDLQTGSLAALMRVWLGAFGSSRLLMYEPINYETVKAVSGGVVPTYHIERSDYLISCGADFLETWISPVEYAARFAEMRQVQGGRRGRFLYIGPRMSMTAANADRRLIVPPGMIAAAAQAVISGQPAQIPGVTVEELQAAAREFAAASSPLALPGLDPDAARAAAAFAAGRPSPLVDSGRPHALTAAATSAEVEAFLGAMESGHIDLLVISGANPAYALASSDRFRQALQRVPMVVSLSPFMDETTALAHWALPASTPMESWGDYRPYPDIVNIMQPAMGLLFDTRQAGDILLDLAKSAGVEPARAFKAASFYEFLRLRWGFPLPPGANASTVAPAWEAVVAKGGRFTPSPGAAPAAGAADQAALPESPTPAAGQMRLWAYPHLYFYDGRGANRRWLQEMPEPITNAVWGTWAELHPETARKLGIETDDVIEIAVHDRKIQVPAIVWDGIAPDTVAVPIGEGHEVYGRFAAGIGANVLPLLAAASPPVTVSKTGKSKWAARLRGADEQYGREIVQTVSLEEPFKREEEIIMPLPEGFDKGVDFYKPHEHSKHRWAMTVDLDRCIGCHACTTACYAENNIGVVGAEQIRKRREMAWLRIDRYFEKSETAPVLFQPMLCQHCDSAPCEVVCPVYAASHGEEGVNMQVYNRCVGTRYCSHNCPYKARKFNWFDYRWPDPLNYQLNPDVTVRCRGVMEKCTFCIQRIREVEMVALRENRKVRDGEIVPACVQTCPTGVFTFGDLLDPDAAVTKIIRNDPRAYQVLREMNTKTAVIYLKKIVERR